MMSTQHLLALVFTALSLTAAAQPAPSPTERKVLHVSFRSAESTIDPAKASDLYSRTITPHIFEALYQYDHLARPIKIEPLIADGMPQVSADFRTWTIRIRPGIYFADDPAFKGQRRELVAQDFVYAIKRYADPALKSPAWGGVQEVGFTGLAALRQRALDAKQPFDYEAPVEGLRALDLGRRRFSRNDLGDQFVDWVTDAAS